MTWLHDMTLSSNDNDFISAFQCCRWRNNVWQVQRKENASAAASMTSPVWHRNVISPKLQAEPCVWCHQCGPPGAAPDGPSVKNGLSSPPCLVWLEQGWFSCVCQLIALLVLDLTRPLGSGTSAGDNLTQRVLQVKEETAQSRPGPHQPRCSSSGRTDANEQHVMSPWWHQSEALCKLLCVRRHKC